LIGCHNLSINKIKKDSTISNNRLNFIRDANVTRKDARTDRMEDYLEMIYELIKQKGYASTVDISNYLNIQRYQNDSAIR
jgi:hypothetical protein